MYVHLYSIPLCTMRIEDEIKQPIFRNEYQKAFINPRAKEADQAVDFSKRIRVGLPGFE